MALNYEILLERMDNNSYHILDIWVGNKNDDDTIEFLYSENHDGIKKISEETTDLIDALRQTISIDKVEIYIRRRKYPAAKLVKDSNTDIKLYSSAGGYFECDQADIVNLLDYLVNHAF